MDAMDAMDAMMEEKKVNSLDLHLRLVEKFNDSPENPSTEEIIAVLDAMGKELLVEGYSPLLECSYSLLQKRTKYVPQYFRANKPALKKAVSVSDAQIWLYLLESSLTENTDALSDQIAEYQASICKKVKLTAPAPQAVDEIIQKIDNQLVSRRSALWAASHVETHSQGESDEVTDAPENAALLVCKPSRSNADRENYLALHNESIAFFTQQFNQLRPALVGINDQMRTMEDLIHRKNTEKAYRQWIELYDLIADVKESTYRIAKETENSDLENAAYNLEEFLYMISDALAEYGIDTIVTAPGSPFNGKYHDVGNEKQFDPKTAIVAESVRSGFVWGEQVMKKERIKLNKQEETH